MCIRAVNQGEGQILFEAYESNRGIEGTWASVGEQYLKLLGVDEVLWNTKEVMIPECIFPTEGCWGLMEEIQDERLCFNKLELNQAQTRELYYEKVKNNEWV